MSKSGMRRPLVAVLCWLLICWIPLVTTPARAQQLGEVTVEITELTPDTLNNTGDLVISGRVTNTTDQPLTGVSVGMWRDATPLHSLAELDAALGADEPSGALMTSATANTRVNGDGSLAAGEQAEFTVQASMSPEAAEQLWLSEPGAVYQIGVEVYGSPATGSISLLGRATSFMLYPTDDPVPGATIVVLARTPSLLPLPTEEDAPPEFVDGRLAAELAGRLETLLQLAEQPGVLTVIDPALYDEVQALTLPHRELQPDGSWAQLTADPRAADWLDRVGQMAQEGRLTVGLYGMPDVTAATAAGQQSMLSGPAADHQLAGLPLVVVPAGGAVDEPTLAALTEVQPWLVLASNIGHSAQVRTTGAVRLLATSWQASGAAIDDPPTRSLFLVEQFLTANQGAVPVNVVHDEGQAALVTSLADRQDQRAVTDLVADPDADVPLTAPAATDVTVPTQLVAAAETAKATLVAFGELVDQAELAGDASARMIPQSWSITFERDEKAQMEWLRLAAAPADGVLAPDAVALLISDWITTSADDNLLPVTLSNHTTYPVTVQVRFQSENPLRIEVDDSEPVTVQPGESSTVRVRPRTAGNGKTAIEAQLVTVGGHPVGRPVGFVITGTEAGRVGWMIIVASGVVLLVATAARVHQVRAGRR